MTKQDTIITGAPPSWRMILALAWPAVVEQFLQTIVNYVDTAMVGSIGVDATAAVGLSTSVIWLIFGLMHAVGVGFSVLAAHQIGAGRMEEAKHVIRQAVLSIFVVGGLLSVLMVFGLAPRLPVWMNADPEIIPLATSYLQIFGSVYVFHMAVVVCSSILRCAGDTKTPMQFNLVTNIINVVANFMLIYPTTQFTLFGHTVYLYRAGLGVTGAALATAGATAFTGIRMLFVLFRRTSPIQISLKESFRPDQATIRQAARLGFPAAMERMTISLGHLASTVMITGLGKVSLAAHQLASTGESLCFMPAGGFALAATSLVARYLGAGRQEDAILCAKWCFRLAVSVMIACSTLMYLFSVPIIDLFSNDLHAIELGARMLRIEAFAEPFLAIGMVAGGVFQGSGDVRWSALISLLGIWAVRIPSIMIMLYCFHWDLSAVWVAMIFDWVVRATVSLIHFRRRTWIRVLSA